MVRPILEYASSVWDPHTTANIQKLESVQRRAARFCLNDHSHYSSVTNMLLLLNLPSLQSRRKSTKLMTMYKIINGNVHIPSNSLIPIIMIQKVDTSPNYKLELTLINFLFFPPLLSYGTPPSLCN